MKVALRGSGSIILLFSIEYSKLTHTFIIQETEQDFTGLTRYTHTKLNYLVVKQVEIST